MASDFHRILSKYNITATYTEERMYTRNPLPNPQFIGTPPPFHQNVHLESQRVVKLMVGEKDLNKLLSDLVEIEKDQELIYKHPELWKMHSQLKMMIELYK